jgi:hypothetical protein
LRAKTSVEDLVYLKEQIEDGKVVPVQDRRYPLSEIAEAPRAPPRSMPKMMVLEGFSLIVQSCLSSLILNSGVRILCATCSFFIEHERYLSLDASN